MIVKFDRIGRTGSAPESALTVQVPDAIKEDPNDIAEFLERHASRYLASRWFDVTVDLGANKVWIEAGRFGQGVIEP